MSSAYLTGTKNFWSIVLVVFLRYLILAGIAFVIYYIIRKKAWQYKKIQFNFPLQRDYFREIIYSFFTTFIFACIGYLIFVTPIVSYTKVYYKISDYGTAYLLFSVLLILILHDTYFYWAHRLMHLKGLYRLVHRVHHQSTNPSPWAAMAFHPVEAVVESGILVIVPFLFPVHPLAIGIFLLLMMSYNVYGHLGYELYPKGFSRTWIGKWINTSVNHNMHHQTITGNYGLYFLYWDRMMGTLHSTYDEEFDEVKSKKVIRP